MSVATWMATEACSANNDTRRISYSLKGATRLR
jgi:hypothetical protein